VRAHESHAGWIKGLLRPEAYPHGITELSLLETHISWVILTGRFAYKIKKPVNLGFLDFSTLALRHAFCLEELRVNRRTAPGLYLDVVPITGTPTQPVISGDGKAFEYAVRMQQFAGDAVFSQLASGGRITEHCIDALAERLASFHNEVPPAGLETLFGSPETVARAVKENLSFLLRSAGSEEERRWLDELDAWSRRQLQSLSQTLVRRRAGGYVRECHGDLHLGNLALIEGQPTPFDAIEFSPELRWIDIISEVAFLTMDLEVHALTHLAYRFINRYEEILGDYAGLRLWPFYCVYRALVRAKVARLTRTATRDPADHERHDIAYRDYLSYAHRAITPRRPLLLITHGLSGSGKSTIAGRLAEKLGAIRVRSDVERKRLAPNLTGPNLYTADMTRRTYARLTKIASGLLCAGLSVIVDATFLHAAERDQLRNVAHRLHVPFRILDVEAPDALLRERIAARRRAAHDPSDATSAVLDRQRSEREPLLPQERDASLRIDGAAPDVHQTLAALRKL